MCCLLKHNVKCVLLESLWGKTHHESFILSLYLISSSIISVLESVLLIQDLLVSLTNQLIVLYENIDQTLSNKSHGPIHYNIGVTCIYNIYNGHVFYTLL